MTATGLRILHLDDDVLYLEQFATTMSAASLDVPVVVDSVDDVDAYFERLAPVGEGGAGGPDIVVLDVNVGGRLCGQDIAKKTRELAPEAIIFMCSDMKGVGLVGVCLSSGADDFIFKGSDEDELALRLYGTWKLRAGERAAASSPTDGPSAVGATMTAVATRMRRLVGSAVSAVHVRGESGTGKELVSELLAGLLPKGAPFIRVNCGAIAPSLLESELFGHVRGAFTGATSDKAGLLEQANGGWIFLDEVATLSPAAQVALLRVLESHTVRRVGSAFEKPLRIKVLSATNEPIESLIEAGRFRADLWQRLCEATIDLPPLRERMHEFRGLVEHFCATMAHGPYSIAESAIEILAAHDWHEGNVRELRNTLRAMTELAIGKKMLTPLSIPKAFWEKIDRRPDDSTGEGDISSAPCEPLGRSLTLHWDADALPPFEQLSQQLLLAIVRREAGAFGKVSIRQLSRSTAIPKSTLSVKLRGLVDQGLIGFDELAKLVNVGRD